MFFFASVLSTYRRNIRRGKQKDERVCKIDNLQKQRNQKTFKDLQPMYSYWNVCIKDIFEIVKKLR